MYTFVRFNFMRQRNNCLLDRFSPELNSSQLTWKKTDCKKIYSRNICTRGIQFENMETSSFQSFLFLLKYFRTYKSKKSSRELFHLTSSQPSKLSVKKKIPAISSNIFWTCSWVYRFFFSSSSEKQCERFVHCAN